MPVQNPKKACKININNSIVQILRARVRVLLKISTFFQRNVNLGSG